MVLMLAAHDGSGGRSPGVAKPPRPLIRLCDPSLCRATTARAERRATNAEGRHADQRWYRHRQRDALGHRRHSDGVVLIDRKLAQYANRVAGLAPKSWRGSGGAVRVGLDVIGGIAGLAEAMLAERGFALVHVPGLAVNRARQGTVGGENKSDPRDARAIADKVRTRGDLRAIEPDTELNLEIRLLVGRRRDLVDRQTQRVARMHDLLVGIFPGLERALDLITKGPLHLLTRFVTPAELRGAGKKRIVRHLQTRKRPLGHRANPHALPEPDSKSRLDERIRLPPARQGRA